MSTEDRNREIAHTVADVAEIMFSPVTWEDALLASEDAPTPEPRTPRIVAALRRAGHTVREIPWQGDTTEDVECGYAAYSEDWAYGGYDNEYDD